MAIDQQGKTEPLGGVDLDTQLSRHELVLRPGNSAGSSLPCSSCVHKGVEAQWIADHPAFDPIVHPTSTAAGYRVAQVGTRSDVGLFALREFDVGDLVSIENPLVIYPQDLPEASNVSGTVDKDLMFARLHESLNKDDEATVMAMANCKGTTMSEFEGILRTNVFGISLPGGPKDALSDRYAALFPIMGRINHSCAPSVALRFDLATFALEIRAVRRIEVGSEITDSYFQDYRSREERQARLRASHNFTCLCVEACGLSQERSDVADARRKRLGTWTQDHISFDAWVSDLGLPDDLFVKDNLKAMKLIDLERLSIDSFVYLDNLAKGYAALENQKKYSVWATRAHAIALAHLGPQSEVVKNYSKGLANCLDEVHWGKRRSYREAGDRNFQELLSKGISATQTWEEIMQQMLECDNVGSVE